MPPRVSASETLRGHLFHYCAILQILGQENAQNMTRYNTVEQGKTTDGKRSNKTAGLNDPNFV